MGVSLISAACLAMSLMTKHTTALPQPVVDPQDAASFQLNAIQLSYQAQIRANLTTRTTGCTNENLTLRREWGSLPHAERQSYIDAVYCLMSLPARTSTTDVPGARTRYDDFVATHVLMTPYIHFSGLFLPYHRRLVSLWETALRTECGYTGYQPYWDWALSWKDPSASTVFDGSPYSLGSNGAFTPHGPTNVTAFGNPITLPSGTGGGCIYTGPFTNYTVNLGPVTLSPPGPDGGLGYNPRCLERDLNPYYSNRTRPSDVLGVVTNCTDIACFDTQLEAGAGVHGSGHFTMGGDGADVYTSPNDPAFWLHHAQVDRVWTLWQSLDFPARTTQTWGTGTAFNNPPSANVTLDTDMDFGVLDAHLERILSAVSTVDGPFCYMYV